MYEITKKLYWKTWEGSLPGGAVGIHTKNGTQYVSRPTSRGECGYYNPNKGPYCHYPFDCKEWKDGSFEIFVNEDDFEDLVWRDASNGSVPENAVQSAYSPEIYVGRNKDGLGKVRPQLQSFFLPWEGKEYPHNNYQVLTYNTDFRSQEISEVKYDIDKGIITDSHPETVKVTEVSNNSSSKVTKTVTFSETITLVNKWETSGSFRLGVQTEISARIPSVVEGKITVSTETTHTEAKTGSMTKTKEFSETLSLDVLPNKTAKISLVAYKCKLNIPFTACLSRTYSNGKKTKTNISGTYTGVEVDNVKAVITDC
ncbi:Natterin-4 [Oryzias melastigma]|uniref:Natterin-4 n=1 Tax=Oryzias melastigma TaxID=30732 RepID=A0A834EWI3_ORYME|nr:Natterin-4 [Oryzias melastigma]